MSNGKDGQIPKEPKKKRLDFPNYAPITDPEDFGQADKPIPHTLFTRKPTVKELGERLPVTWDDGGTKKKVERINGKLYYVEMKAL